MGDETANREKAEELLNNYNKIYGHLISEFYATAELTVLDSVSFVSGRKTGKNATISSKVEDVVMDHEAVSEKAKKLWRINMIIDGAIENALSSDERSIIKQTYLDSEEKETKYIAGQLNMSPSTVRRKRAKAIDRLIDRGMLKAWKFYEQVDLDD